MSFPFAAISIFQAAPSHPEEVLVAMEDVKYAAQTALLAISRMADARLDALVAERVQAAERINKARWFAFGPFRAETNKGVLRRQLLEARPADDDAWFMATMNLRIMRKMAIDALAKSPRADGRVALSTDAWDILHVYRRSEPRRPHGNRFTASL